MFCKHVGVYMCLCTFLVFIDRVEQTHNSGSLSMQWKVCCAPYSVHAAGKQERADS